MGFFSLLFDLVDLGADMLETVDKSYTKPRSIDEKIAHAKNEQEAQALILSRALDKKYAAEERMNRETDPIKKRKMQDMITNKVYEFDIVFGPEK